MIYLKVESELSLFVFVALCLGSRGGGPGGDGKDVHKDQL